MTGSQPGPRLTILGCRLDECDMPTATTAILDAVTAHRLHGAPPVSVVTLGTEMIVRAQKDPLFKGAVERANFVLCDTIGVLLAARLRGSVLKKRVPGIALLEALCAALALQGGSVYLLGGKEQVAHQAAQKLLARFPGLRIAGMRNGYFRDEESHTVASAVKASGAQLLLVALGSPKQEMWIDRYLGETGAGAAIGVGGAFDVLAGLLARAPRIWQALGLEWLYRLYQEPSRWRRQLALPLFVLLTVRETVAVTLSRRSPPR